MATHTGDRPEAVTENRNRLSRALGISQEWVTLTQVHGCRAVRAGEARGEEGDGLIAETGDPPISVLVADCAPIAIAGRSRSAVVHGGWRGLCSGVIEEALKMLQEDEPQAWVGPAIGPCHFEVGPDVVRRFAESYPGAPPFTVGGSGKVEGSGEREGAMHFDLPAATRWVLRSNGVEVDDDPAPCTFCDTNFYSYRRDGMTGRQAVIAWR